ncbi:MAG: MFS transporter [Limimaricola sp.]
MSSTAGPRRIFAMQRLRVFYVWAFLSKLSVLTPFFALYLAHRVGIGTAGISMLFATYTATRLVSEVPLGALADRIGETSMLRVSSVLAFCGLACLVFGPLPALFLGQALFALSESASSGAQESLLFRLTGDGEEDRDTLPYRVAQPAFDVAAWSGLVSAGVLGALVVTLSLDLLGPVALAIAVSAAAVAMLLPAAPRSNDGDGETEALRLERLGAALRSGGAFRFWFLGGAAASFVLTVTYFTIQPLLNEIELAGAGNGILYSAVTVFAAYGGHVTTSLNASFKRSHTGFVAALALVVVAIVGLRFAGSLATLFFAMAVLRFAWGWIRTTTTMALNESVPVDGLRATIMSVQSLATGLLGTAALALFAGLGLSAGVILLTLAALTAGGITLTLAAAMRHFNHETKGDHDVPS